MLELITSKQEVARAYAIFEQVLTKGSRELCRYQRAVQRHHPEVGIYSHLDPTGCGNRYWCGFSVNDITARPSKGFDVLINFSYEGSGITTGAAFVRDGDGAVMIVHTGNIRGGGKAGVSPAVFWKEFQAEHPRTSLLLPSGKFRDVIIIGRLDESGFMSKLAAFVREVARIKGEILRIDVRVPRSHH